MTEGAAKLLRELALLLRRHPPHDFVELARLIGSPEFVISLTKILADLATTDRKAGIRRRDPSRADILEEIRAVDPTKHALLRDAQERLFDKHAYPSLRDLANALESSGIPLPKKPFRKRQDIVLSFIRAASTMDTKDIAHALSKIASSKTKSELSNWSSMIVPKKHVREDG